MIRFLSLVLCLLGTMHPLVAVGIRGTSDESARDLTSSLTCPYGQSVEEALFVMNVTITGATATSQKETLAYLEGAIARFTYIFAESISLDLQVQPMCKNEEEPEDSDYTKISTRRRTQDAVFFFPIGGDCYFCPPDNGDDRRQLHTTRRILLQRLSNRLEWWLCAMLDSREPEPGIVDVNIALTEVATRDETHVDRGC